MKTLALIGVGKWGKNIVSTLERLPEARLRYLCARKKESLAPYPDTYEKLTDWHKILERTDLDAVLIATPPSTHYEFIESALKAGKDVFVEKPMVLSLREAEQIQELVLESGRVFMVGYEYLFNDHINYLKKEIENGSLGKILEVRHEHVLSPSRPDVDIFWDEAPHPLSIFLHFFNPQKLISAEGDIQHDTASVQATFEKAPSLRIIASCLGNTKTRKLTIIGEKSTAVLDETLKENKVAITKNGQTTYPEINSSEPLRNELKHFVRCIETRETPLSNVDFGCRITEWLETILEKLK